VEITCGDSRNKTQRKSFFIDKIKGKTLQNIAAPPLPNLNHPTIEYLKQTLISIAKKVLS
jgi:hypothetical protein